MWRKLDFWWLSGLIIGFIFLMGLFVSFRNKQIVLDQKYESDVKELSQLTKKLEEKQVDVYLASYEDSSTLTMTDRFERDNLLVARNAAQLFNIILTWDDGKTYASRRERAASLATEDVLLGGFFSKGEDVSGNSQIDTLRLHSALIRVGTAIVPSTISSNNVSVLAQVQADAWTEGKDRGRSVDLFSLDFNLDDDKFSSLQRLGRLRVDSESDLENMTKE